MAEPLKLRAIDIGRQPSVTDMVYDALYGQIVNLDLRPGTKLSEAEVATQLGVSRQPVRDAFYRLSQQGFLLIRPQRATVVMPISMRAVHQARFIREALELEVVRTVTETATDADFDALDALIKEQQSAIDAGDEVRFHTLDDGFHQMMCEIAGQPEVWQLIKDNKAHMDRVRYLTLKAGDAQRAHNEHVLMMAALRARDLPLVEATTRAHIGRISRIVGDIRDAHSDYFEEDDT